MCTQRPSGFMLTGNYISSTHHGYDLLKKGKLELYTVWYAPGTPQCIRSLNELIFRCEDMTTCIGHGRIPYIH